MGREGLGLKEKLGDWLRALICGRLRGIVAARVVPALMRTYPPTISWALRSMVLWAALGAQAGAMQVTGYSSAVNDRFSEGFPTAPTNNADTNFVGTGYDWSGVGWASTDGTKGFGLISPRHFLVASHYGGAAAVRVFNDNGVLATVAQQSVTNTGYGISLSGVLDLSVGTLVLPGFVPSSVARYAVLDLNSSSTTNDPGNYVGLPVLLYGRGPNGTFSPRIGATTINDAVSSGTNQYFTTPRAQVQLEGGDSGSPAFHGWTNPNGGLELTILGNNAAIDASNNYLNFLGSSLVMNALNATMTTGGYALRVAGNPTSTWVGSASTAIGSSNAWAPGPPAPTDAYVLFDAVAASNRAVDVTSDHDLRGLYFKSGAGTNDGFGFSGAGTLTVGRGGVVNYDADRQVFDAALRLGDHQYWDGGTGGVTVSNLHNNGKLLEVAGAGTNRINGVVSGSGGLAVSGGRLELAASNTFTGGTWVHEGQLSVAGSIADSSGLRLDAAGSVAGSGKLPVIAGAGAIDPGSSAGILTTPAVNPTNGLTFNFEFTGLNPVFSAATASVNDLLRLTAGAPFVASLGAVNTVNVFFSFASLNPGDVYTGGFFTDEAADFLTSIENSIFKYFVAAGGPGMTNYNGTGYDELPGSSLTVSTVGQSADFADGTVDGRVARFQVVPEPSVWALLALAAGLLLVRARRARKITG